MLFVLGNIDSCRGILVCSGCDNCNEWFHGHCINITEKMAKAIQEWYCMSCRGQRFSFSVAVVSSCKNNNNNKKTTYLLFTFFISFSFWYVLDGKKKDENPLLEVKYRSKKSREKEPDSDRTERQYSTPSTPDYRSDRRRGSKVGRNRCVWKR